MEKYNMIHFQRRYYFLQETAWRKNDRLIIEMVKHEESDSVDTYDFVIYFRDWFFEELMETEPTRTNEYKEFGIAGFLDYCRIVMRETLEESLNRFIDQFYLGLFNDDDYFKKEYIKFHKKYLNN